MVYPLYSVSQLVIGITGAPAMLAIVTNPVILQSVSLPKPLAFVWWRNRNQIHI